MEGVGWRGVIEVRMVVTSKDTVVYICEDYVVSGVQFYWKRELLTLDSYRNPESLYWSRRKPISAKTYRNAQRQGYKCDVVRIMQPPGVVVLFDEFVRTGTPRPPSTRRRRKRKRGEALRLFLSR